MTITEIRQILESPYNRNVWKSFLQTQFTNNKLNAEDRIISLSDNTVSKQCLSLGFYEIDNYTKIGIFEIELNDKVNLARNRVALRNLLKDITKQMAGAMVVFVQGEKWRFSYISKRKFLNKKTNTIEDKETAPKRYTYLFGKGEKALTAAQRFDKLIQKQKANLFDLLSLNDFEEAFSVEKLGKEFFKNYKEIYEDFVEYITGNRYVKKGSKWEKTKVHDPHFDFNDIFKNDSKAVRDFFKRMMGRIVFLYFIQKKGWLAVPKGKNWDEGNTDYLYQLFKNAKYKELFYSDYLVPLFFDTLNNEKSEDENNDLRFPYLNGGLFSDEQDRQYNKLALPSAIFEKLFENFNNYNFTIYEDAPDEHTVAVDPEMLGHIFENLLEDNKDKGAFYTPKEIVHYMCKESLKAYLVAKDELEAKENNVAQSALENIIQQQELNTEELKYADKNAYKIIDALESVKICDPAIGSGAFPMGLLQEIFNAQVYLQELKGFTKAKTDADIKKHIIEESIFGADIDEGAVDIARLRFWLSLVVDEPKPQPLPNLSFKIVCANTLIPLGKAEGDLGGTKAIADEIEAVREDYFDANKDAKKDLERQFRNLQAKLWTTAKEWATGKDVEIYKKISEFNPFEDKSCSWFDPWWMFGIQDGFDIVIGNPPYVQLQKDGGKLATLYQSYNYKTFARTGDIYSLFYEKGIQLLRSEGILCFITSNKWMRAGYGELTRNFFIENTQPLELIDFAGQQIFDNATVDTNILIIKKASYNFNTKACIVKEKWDSTLTEYVKQNQQEIKFTQDNSWVILSPIEQSIKEKIERIGTPLKDWDINIYRGILTGFNEAFIIDGKKKDELIAEDPKSAEIIRPILRGRDIKRYDYVDSDQWLIVTHNGYKDSYGNQIDRINVENYPAIKKHLDTYWNEIEKRQDQGSTPYNLRNCAYMDEFSKQKIIYPETTQGAYFAYDSGETFIDKTCFMLISNKAKFLQAILSSKLFEYAYKKIFSSIELGENGYQYNKHALIKLPIFNPSFNQINQIIMMFDNQDYQNLDLLIFKIYDIKIDEINYLNSQ